MSDELTPEVVDEVPFGDGEVSEVADDAEPAEIVDEGEPDPWSWTEGLDPEKVSKTWNKFTESWDDIAKEKEQLAPLKQLQEAINSDPGLISAIEGYYNSDQGEEAQVEVLKRQVAGMQSRLAVDQEIADLRKYVDAEGYPAFDPMEVVEYARTRNLGNLQDAYLAKNTRAIAEAEREKALADIKKSKGAKAVTTTTSAAKGKLTFSKAEIAAMTAKEFEANYPAIQAQYAK